MFWGLDLNAIGVQSLKSLSWQHVILLVQDVSLYNEIWGFQVVVFAYLILQLFFCSSLSSRMNDIAVYH